MTFIHSLSLTLSHEGRGDLTACIYSLTLSHEGRGDLTACIYSLAPLWERAGERGDGCRRVQEHMHRILITSITPSIFVSISLFQNLSTVKPCESSHCVRSLSFSFSRECLPPSASTISPFSKQTKSAMKWPICSCRRNFNPSSCLAFRRCHKSRSASVEFFRNSLAVSVRLTGILLPLSLTLSHEGRGDLQPAFTLSPLRGRGPGISLWIQDFRNLVSFFHSLSHEGRGNLTACIHSLAPLWERAGERAKGARGSRVQERMHRILITSITPSILVFTPLPNPLPQGERGLK